MFTQDWECWKEYDIKGLGLVHCPDMSNISSCIRGGGGMQLTTGIWHTVSRWLHHRKKGIAVVGLGKRGFRTSALFSLAFSPLQQQRQHCPTFVCVTIGLPRPTQDICQGSIKMAGFCYGYIKPCISSHQCKWEKLLIACTGEKIYRKTHLGIAVYESYFYALRYHWGTNISLG